MPNQPPVHRSQLAQRPRTNEPYRRLLWTRGFRDRFRPWFLRRHPLCQRCHAQGLLRPAVHVHHRRKLEQHPEDLCDEQHCEALCHACHSAATGRGE